MAGSMDMASHPAMANARAHAPARWAALADAAAEANAFYLPEMLCAALDHLADGATVRVLEAQRDGELIGLMPVVVAARSEERRVGKEGVRTCRSRWSPYH